ncbi:MAG: T9SS type A sorting domain-containing protein, partial [Saprospiraceae bacterium]|nr:T9SS type A sorting domain-containing protein [Saprospiraceae bacterium]
LISYNNLTNSSSYSSLNGIFCGSHANVTCNIIENSSGKCIEIYTYNTLPVYPSTGIISNNYIKNHNGIGIILYGTTEFIKILNNTIVSKYECINISSSLCQNISIVNNIMENTNNNIVISFNLNQNIISDYNLLHTNGNYIGKFGSTNISTISVWQNSLGLDSNSVSMSPMFYSAGDYHIGNPLLDNLGTPVPEVIIDLDGQPRDSLHPDIGADEFDFTPVDLSPTKFIHNLIGECYTNSETLKVRVKNYGTTTINFNQDTATITMSIGGVISTTITKQITTGYLQVGSTLDVIMTNTFNMLNPGTYIFNVSTSIPSDGNSGNDNLNTVSITNAQTSNFPFFTDFQLGNQYDFSNGWLQDSLSLYQWEINSGPTPSFNTGPSADHTTQTITGNYIFANGNSYDTNGTAQLVSPCIDISGLIQPKLKFWYHMYGYNIGSLNVDIYNGSSWINNAYTVTGQQQTSSATSWQQGIINLNNYSGFIKIRFRAIKNSYGFQGDLALDDIVISGLPPINLGNDTSICAGNTLVLDAGSGYNYQWKKLPSSTIIGTNQTLNVSTSGTYVVTITDPYSFSNSDTIVVTVNPLPIAFAGADSSVCATSFTLSSASAQNYSSLLWTTLGSGSFSNVNIQNPVYNPGITDISNGSVKLVLSLSGLSPCGNTTDTITLTFIPLPIVSFSGLGNQYCLNSNIVSLSGTPSNGVYSGPGISGNIFNPSIAGVGIHGITYTYTDVITGCSNSQTQYVMINSLPQVSISGLAASYCLNSTSSTLSGLPANGTFSGSGIVGNSFNPSIAGAGSHSVFYTCPADSNGCFNTDTQTVIVNPLPTVSFSGLPTSCCLNDSAFILIGNPAGGSFSGTALNGNSFNPTIAGAGFHSITYSYTDAYGCSNSVNQGIMVNPLPYANAGTNQIIQCGGAGVNIGSAPTIGFSYLWYPTWGLSDSTNANPLANPNLNTLYFLKVTNNTSGCYAYDSVLVSILGGPTAVVSNDTIICLGESVTLNASGGSTYQWSNGGNTNSITVSPAVTTKYIVTVTSGACADSDTITVFVNNPSVNLGSDTSICYNESIVLDAGVGFSSYLWSNGETTQIITVDSTGIGISSKLIIVVVEDSIGCEASDSVIITINPCDMMISENLSEPNIKIYPNPTTGKINIRIENIGSSDSKLCLYNTIGSLVYCKEFTDQINYEIDLSSYPKGIYYIRIENMDFVKVEKVIVQ